METVSNLSQRLTQILAEKEISQNDFARTIGLSKQAVSTYCTGRSVPKKPAIMTMARSLGVNPMWLMGYDVDKTAVDKPSAIPPGFIPVPEMQKVPLVGRIACGTPITAEENVEDYIDAPKDKNIDFCLLCKGDSMIDAGIDDGDMVYIRKQPDVENGEIAAVRIGDEAILKRVYKYPDCIVLEAENRAYAPLRYFKEDMNNVVIEGKAVAWVHWV